MALIGIEERQQKSLTEHTRQVFQDFDCPILPELTFCSRQDTA